MRNNYNLLKWLINYSRFAAKLLPKLQLINLNAEEKSPLVELTARALHMTLSKLTKIDRTHLELGMANFSHFKRTSRFAKIKAVSAEYHQKYFLLLSKMPYNCPFICGFSSRNLWSNIKIECKQWRQSIIIECYWSFVHSYIGKHPFKIEYTL